MLLVFISTVVQHKIPTLFHDNNLYHLCDPEYDFQNDLVEHIMRSPEKDEVDSRPCR